MKKEENTHQSLFSLTSWFKNNQGIRIHETFSLELFKSLVAFPHPNNEESSLNESRIITSPKLIGTLNEDIRLKINPHITLIHEQRSQENHFNLIQGFRNESSTIEFDTLTRLALKELLPYLNGNYTIKEIANLHSSSEIEVLHALQPLYEIGFLFLCSKSLIPALSFYTHLMSTEHPKKLNNITLLNTHDKEGLRKALIRNLFTTYHYARSFPDHLSEAISQTTNFELKEQLCSTLSENYWYSNMLLKGLMELDYTREQIKRSTSCPATLGAINYLRWLAKTDLLSYAACLGIMEYPRVSANTFYDISNFIQAEWEYFEDLNLITKEALEPFKKQKKLALLSQKSHLSKCFFEVEPYLTPEHQAEIQYQVGIFIECQQAEALMISLHYKTVAA